MLTTHDWLTLCSRDPDRPGLARPWRYEGYVYASDGASCVRAPDDPSVEDCAESCGAGVPAKAAAVFFAAWPTHAGVVAEVWPLLLFAGRRRLPVHCEPCDGYGSVALVDGQDGGGLDGATEDTRQGREVEGVVECWHCEGSGTQDGPLEIVEVHGILVDSSLLARTLWALNQLAIGGDEWVHLWGVRGDGTNGPLGDKLLLRHEEAEAVIMGLHRSTIERRGAHVARAWPAASEEADHG